MNQATATSTQRARILRALNRLCAERGYEQLELPALCRAAEVTEADFHRHFADLDDCFSVSVEEGTAALLAAVGSAFAARSTWRPQLRACAWSLLDFLRADLDWARLMVTEIPAAPERARSAREFGMAALAALLDAARSELADPDRLPANTAALTAGAIYARIEIAVEADGLAEGDSLVPELLYLAVRPYFGAEAARAEFDQPRPRLPASA